VYRSGDLCRRGADGALMYLGRNDDQVKIRGYRIELGEIEAVLRSVEGVREAAVTVRQHDESLRIAAYVIPDEATITAPEVEARIEEWSGVFDAQADEETGLDDQAPDFDIVGWNSSYTREAIPAEAMREWVDRTLDRLRALRPQAVLEIGCGTGLLLQNLAADCVRYVGTDLSSRTVAKLARRIASTPAIAGIAQVHAAPADDLRGVEGEFDTAILSSVAQYFPDIEYLERTIVGAIERLRPGGRMFVGDVRHYGLAKAFHLSVALFQYDGSDDVDALPELARRRALVDRELLVDPAWFLALKARHPRIADIVVMPKLAAQHTEMSAFRFDVCIEVRDDDRAQPQARSVPLRESWAGIDALRTALAALPQGDVLVLRDIPHPWVSPFVRMLGERRIDRRFVPYRPDMAAAAASEAGLLPIELEALCAEHGRALRLSWVEGVDGGYHAAIGAVDAISRWSWDDGAFAASHSALGALDNTLNNRPLLAASCAELPARLHVALAGALPDYMVPSAFVVMDEWPLTPSGKLDRASLPAPSEEWRVLRAYAAPENDYELALAALWSALLGIDGIGRNDHFFELGGHSLLAVRLVARIRERFGVELPLREVFGSPVLADQAARIRETAASAFVPVPVLARDRSLPLSWAQQRLWFLERLDPAAGAAYRMVAGLRIDGALDRAALRRALDRMVERHETLRTRFLEVQGAPALEIDASDVGFVLRECDLSELPAAERISAFDSVCREEAAQPMPLDSGPPVRGCLVRLGPHEHALLIVQHHIVSDGWSFGILQRELAALYTAFVSGESDPLPPLTLQYVDYAGWQREHLNGTGLDRQIDYWRAHLDDAPALLELPLDRPRPVLQTHRGGMYVFEVDAATTAALQALSRRHGATLFMTLLGGWALLLSRLGGQSQVVIGTPIANRVRHEFEALIGFFVNMLPLHIRIDAEASLAALIRRVRDVALAGYEHQDVPFERLVEALRPERSLSHHPVYQTIFSLNNTPDARFDAPGLMATPIDLPSPGVRADLALSMQDTGDGLTGHLEYAGDLFDATTIARWAEHFVTLLRGFARNPGLVCGRLPLLTYAERKRLLDGFNATAVPYPRDATLADVFADIAQRTPDAIALRWKGVSTTYAELDAAADRLAACLRTLGAVADARVALCAGRCPELVIAMLAVAKSGAAYVPMDPDYPEDRLRYMIEDSAPIAAISVSALHPLFEACGIPILAIEAIETVEAIGDGRDEPVPAALATRAPGDLAYVIYTSGSTGRPKGVAIEQRQVLHLTAVDRDIRIVPGQRVVHCATPAFDAATWEVWSTLLRGATLVIVDDDTLLDPVAFKAELRRERVDILHLTIGLFNRYADALAEVYPDLDALLFGGEQCDPAIVAKVASRSAPKRLIHCYGPTETTTFATTLMVPREIDPTRRPPIGRPIANARIYILDARGEPVPIGIAGEIHVGGDGVGRGYLGRPELTDEKFVADPFASMPGARMYRTGDLGRWSRDGQVEYLGRNDFQVKIRGYRIEPGEIEASLARVEGVRETVVLARPDALGGKRLVAYCLCDPEAAPSADALRAALSVDLPEYMVPSAFVFLDVWPLTRNGKLDREALPAPESGGVAEDDERPWTATESCLADIWRELLGVAQVGRHDHFFRLGGHSLLVVTLLERLRAAGHALDVRSVFSNPVLHEMAAMIDTASGSLIASSMASPAPSTMPELADDALREALVRARGGVDDLKDAYPLSPLQQGMLFHYLRDDGPDPYLIRTVLEFAVRDDLDAFLSGLQAVIDRHDILRTSLHWQGLAEPMQLVHREARLEVRTLSATFDRDARTAVLHATDPVRLRIDIRRPPLMAAYVAQDASDGRWLLGLVNHHLIGDHVSLELVLSEIAAHAAGRAQMLPPPMPYRDFIARVHAAPEAAHIAHFSALLATVDEITAPYGVTDVQDGVTGARNHQRAVPPQLAERARRIARAHGVGAATVFHLAWAMALGAMAGRGDVVFGTVLSGRLFGAGEASRAPGVFINTLPVRVDLAAASSRESLHALHEQLATLVAHEHASLALAQRCSGLGAAAPLFAALLNYRHSAGLLADLDLGEDTTRPPNVDAPFGMRLIASDEHTHYPLAMSIDDYGDGFALKVHCAGGIEPLAVLDRMEIALRALVAAFDDETAEAIAPAALPALSSTEHDCLTRDWNATSHAYPAGETMHAGFERHASARPEAVAVVCG
ncbi:MAG: amino acid adenylation domain-containing protein, partial [Lysobacter sp.]|nr:amino acid adenylation domain-containing protein [Lysobacter sp.]